MVVLTTPFTPGSIWYWRPNRVASARTTVLTSWFTAVRSCTRGAFPSEIVPDPDSGGRAGSGPSTARAGGSRRTCVCGATAGGALAHPATAANANGRKRNRPADPSLTLGMTGETLRMTDIVVI